MHGEYNGIEPSCCPQEPLNAAGERTKESSWLEVRLPFSDANCGIKQSLVKFGGKSIRYGKLFEVIDSLAGDVGHRHCRGCKDITIVTASVDGMSALSDINADKDLVLQAFLTYVGKSSMEIHVNLISDGTLVACTQFIMVARHGVNGAAYVIPGLHLKNAADKDEFARGQIRAAERKVQAQHSLDLVPPRQDEVHLVHELHLRTKKLKAEKRALLANKDKSKEDADLHKETDKHKEERARFKYMRSTSVHSTEIMHQQNRNLHGKVFGGEIMRKAFEMAYITAACHIGNANTQFVAVDDINFLRPVNVGAIMEFRGLVTYTAQSEVVVQVTVEEVDTDRSGERIRTNQLAYIFKTRDGQKAPEVIPEDYGEFVLFLNGKRTYQEHIIEREM